LSQFGDGSQPTNNNGVAPASNNGVIGFVLSLVSFIPVPVVDIVLAILAIVFSSKGLKEEKRGLAIAGLVIGIFGLISSVFFNLFVGLIATL